MAMTKTYAIAKLFDYPPMLCKLKENDKNIVVYEDKEYYVFSEKYDLKKACREWIEKNGWRYPLDLILKHSVDEHHGFKGIKNERLINKLKLLQENLKEDFNELVFAIIQNKTTFIEDAINIYGYKFIWQPIDDKEIVFNGFRIYRKK
jgi:hypothetical protein